MISCCSISFMFNHAINEWKLNIQADFHEKRPTEMTHNYLWQR